MDYTFDKGTHTIHEAALFKIPEVKLVDSVRPELYQRLNDHTITGETYHAGQGFAITASKTFKKFQLEGGFAHIDQDYGVLTGQRLTATFGFSMNGDAFLTGTRVFTRANWNITPYVTLFGYYTHQLTDPPEGNLDLNKQSLNAGATVNFKNLLAKMHIL
jgi:hypothetical protein